jgi:hypothetical protein
VCRQQSLQVKQPKSAWLEHNSKHLSMHRTKLWVKKAKYQTFKSKSRRKRSTKTKHEQQWYNIQSRNTEQAEKTTIVQHLFSAIHVSMNNN